MKVLRVLALLIPSLLLSACGGGGGSSSSSQPGILQFQSGSLSVDENSGVATFTITRTGGSNGAVSVAVASSDGSATSGQDYTSVSTTVSWATGETTAKSVTVPIANDTAAEPDETLRLTLTSPAGGASLGATAASTLTIRDDDLPGPPVIALGSSIRQVTIGWQSLPGATSYRLMRAPDPVSGFTQVGSDYPATATLATIDVAVHRHDWFIARYRIDACNAHGCTASEDFTTFSAMTQAIGYFKASNTGEADLFGTAIALSADGNTLAVSARGEDSNATGANGNELDDSAPNSGAVYVFARNGAQWSQQAYLKASNAQSNDFFGTSLGLSADGNTLAVGADGEDSRATGIGGDETDNTAPASGAAYVFTRAAGQWSQQAYIKASNANSSDEFGRAVALSDDGGTLAVGAVGEDSRATGIGGDQTDNSASFSGAVYVFTRTAGQWSQQAYVKASNTQALDTFGWALALSGNGNTLAVSAPDEDSSATGVGGTQADNGALSSGAAYVFTRAAGQWSQQAYAKASNTESLDQFGLALTLSDDGNTLAVTSLSEASHATGIDGDQTDNSASFAGAAYVFACTAGQWSQQAYVKASNTAASDEFGTSVALSGDGNTLAVGARNEDSFDVGIDGQQANNLAAVAGAAYVFTRAAGQWSQQAYVKASNTEAFDEFGRAVALSDDGSMLAVSAIGEASNATGVGGNQADNSAVQSGAVYLY